MAICLPSSILEISTGKGQRGERAGKSQGKAAELRRRKCPLPDSQEDMELKWFPDCGFPVSGTYDWISDFSHCCDNSSLRQKGFSLAHCCGYSPSGREGMVAGAGCS